MRGSKAEYLRGVRERGVGRGESGVGIRQGIVWD